MLTINVINQQTGNVKIDGVSEVPTDMRATEFFIRLAPKVKQKGNRKYLPRIAPCYPCQVVL